MLADKGVMDYKSGVYSGCPDWNTSVSMLNHAVLIVGMDANRNLIIKNSWGTKWGEKGFATISGTADCGLSRYIYLLTWGYQLMASILFVFSGLILALF